jgi:hypothetical protein
MIDNWQWHDFWWVYAVIAGLILSWIASIWPYQTIAIMIIISGVLMIIRDEKND